MADQLIPLNEIDDFAIRHAIAEIKRQHGVDVLPKGKGIRKFGYNAAVSSTIYSTIMTLPSGEDGETFAATNAIDKISSSDAGDAQDIVIEGHTVDGSGNLTFVVQTVTLAGQTETALTTALARVSRAYNDSATALAGTVYIYEDDTVTAGVPQTAAKIHMIFDTVDEQSQKCATSLSQYDWGILLAARASVIEKTALAGIARLRVREQGKLFRTRDQWGINSGAGNEDFNPRAPFIIQPNSDVLIDASVSTDNKGVAAGFDIILCREQQYADA